MRLDTVESTMLHAVGYDPDLRVLEVIFNPYEVGSYAAGPYSVEISYDDLRPIMRADGLLGN